MDRKSIIIIAISVVLLLSWTPLINKLLPPKRLPAGMTNNAAAILEDTNKSVAAVPPTPAMEGAPTNQIPFVAPTAPEELIEVTNALAHYTFTSQAGGLKEVELLKYPETTTTRRVKQGAGHGVATLNTHARVPTMAVLTSDGLNSSSGFRLTRTDRGVRAETSLSNGLIVLKDFQISSNYLVLAKVRFENRSSNSIVLPPQHWIVGTATPMGPDDNGQNVGTIWYDGSKNQDISSANYFSSRGFMCTPKVPPLEYHGGAGNVVWAAVHNQFFTLAAMPPQPAQAVIVERQDLSQTMALAGTNTTPPQGYLTSLVFPGTNIAAGQAFEREVNLFAGPKEYQTLARIGDQFNNNIDVVMGYSGFFGFFAKALLLAMNWLHHALLLPYGWAIIAITVIIKAVFWPLTAASTRSMKRMQALHPQMKAIQEKYKDDPVKMNRKTMEFMKENKVSPLGGCLPMLLQIPVFFGFYRMIQSAIELRGAPFLWVGDLSKPDTLFIIPGTAFPFNLLPLLMGVTMLWQAKLTPPSPGMDPAQARIMKYMPLMFMVFLYNFSAGLTLYWTVQNLLTIAQTKLTKNIKAPASPAPAPVLTRVPKKRS